MTLECHIEDRGTKLLKAAGCVVKKEGQDGWSDTLVIWAPGRHFWLEWKGPKGTLTRAQKQRIKWLRAMGEPVYVLDKAGDALFVALKTERETKR